MISKISELIVIIQQYQNERLKAYNALIDVIHKLYKSIE